MRAWAHSHDLFLQFFDPWYDDANRARARGREYPGIRSVFL
jgi:hypothetical protein